MAGTKKLDADTPSVTETILLLPRIAGLLGRLMIDPRVPTVAKLKLAGAAAYVALPFSLITTGGHPFLGYLDDLLIVLKCIRSVFDSAGRQVLEDNWRGPKVQLDTVVDTLRRGDDAINALVKKLKDTLTGQNVPAPSPARN